MEDAHTTLLKLDADKDDAGTNAFFAVYDGHGGAAAAKFAGQHVHERMLKDDAYIAGRYTEALKNAFINTDADMKHDFPVQRESSGCTAVAGLLTHDNRLLVANAGDSRAIICSKGEGIAMSHDHKPENTDEKKRIQAAGGYVEFGRVNGNLALSRALGDFTYKRNSKVPVEEQIITCDPEIIERQITEDDEFVVIACDGIWDCLTTQQVAGCIRYLISEGKDLGEICEIICDHCLAPDTIGGAGIGCDNMTILIIALLHGRTKEEWQAWVTDRVKQRFGHYTPTELPRLYSDARVEGSRRRMAAWQQREGYTPPFKQDEPQRNQGGNINVVFQKADQLFTSQEDSDSGEEYESDNELPDTSPDSDGEGTSSSDPTESLKAQLDEFDREEEAERQTKKHKPDQDDSQGEAPPPPATNGDIVPADIQASPRDVQTQKAASFAGGDALNDAVKAE